MNLKSLKNWLVGRYNIVLENKENVNYKNSIKLNDKEIKQVNINLKNV